MSGGHFDYKEWHINNIADNIEQEVIQCGKPIPRQRWEYWQMEHFREHPEDAVNYAYPDPVLRRMEEAVYALRAAAIYAQRVDYLLSGDDGEESFERRLKEELAELNSKSKMGENGVMYYVIDRSKDPYEDDD
ncbi:MAG: hypothetical protein IJ640_06200 [Prevotella sp.]|nr:hypothetical protein [Prevotella sp.]